MQLGELRAAVESVCGTGYLTDITRHFNSCLRMLAARSEEMLRITVSITNGEWTIPDFILLVHSLSLDGQSLPIRVFEPAQKQSPQGGGGEMSWMKVGNRILLHPINNNVMNVDVFYTPRPARLSADHDVPTLRDVEEVLIAYAIWQIKRDEDDLQVANEKGSEYYRAEAAWLHLNGKKNPAPKRISFNLW